ncbi:MAG: hypothetical protein KDB03_07965 [Planctomycetales bacterium]|nr:hypothetical protein [Planctomycetales bacterium]
MALSQRERYLALGVASVAVLFGGQFAFNSVTKGVTDKENKVLRSRNERDELVRQINTGKLDFQKTLAVTPKSLPTDFQILCSQYNSWLLELATSVGMENINIEIPNSAAVAISRRRGEEPPYKAYDFILTADSSTDRIIDFLAGFYDKDYLHSVVDMKVTMNPKVQNQANVQVKVRALALRNAKAIQEASQESSGRLAMPLDEYKKLILNRNPFAPPNAPPRITTEFRDPFTVGENLDEELKAEDPEKQEIEFEFASDEIPEGMRLRGGRIQWRPREVGRFEVMVRAVDSGLPSKSSEKRLVFNIEEPKKEEPKPEPPKFDIAKQAHVSGFVTNHGQPEIWIRSRIEGKTYQLREGEEVQIGDLKAKVILVNLEDGFAQLETDGERWILGMDVSMADAYAKSQIN